MSHPGAEELLGEGENLEVDPPHRLVQTMVALWGDDVKSEGESRVTWEIEPVGDSCRLTVTHDRLREGANTQLYGGWPMILSGLKTWLETGELLTTPGSLMYAAPAPLTDGAAKRSPTRHGETSRSVTSPAIRLPTSQEYARGCGAVPWGGRTRLHGLSPSLSPFHNSILSSHTTPSATLSR